MHETGRVTAISEDSVWVETIQQSACQACAAQKGCGQRLLAKVTGKTTSIRVLAGECDLSRISMDERVVIGIPEEVVVHATLLTYLFPLLTMVIGVIIASHFSNSDGVVALSALSGLVTGGALVRLHSYFHRDNQRVHPVLLEHQTVISSQGLT